MFFLIALWKYIRFVMIYRQVYYSSVNDNEYQLEKMYTFENETDGKLKDNLFAIAAINGLTAYLNETQKIKLYGI